MGLFCDVTNGDSPEAGRRGQGLSQGFSSDAALVSALMAPTDSAEAPPAPFCVLVPWGH